MDIACCNGCVAPKRTATCHFDGTCPEYIAQQIIHEAERDAQYQKKIVKYGLSAQTERCVRKVTKRCRKVRR